MWWFVIFVGFVIASTQSFFYQVFNGLSLFGLMLVFLGTGVIVMKGLER